MQEEEEEEEQTKKESMQRCEGAPSSARDVSTSSKLYIQENVSDSHGQSQLKQLYVRLRLSMQQWWTWWHDLYAICCCQLAINAFYAVPLPTQAIHKAQAVKVSVVPICRRLCNH
jgi:hypothetical protein